MLSLKISKKMLRKYYRKADSKMIYKFLQKLLTKNNTRIPLFITYFDYQKYKQIGKANSCIIMIHPLIANDKFIQHYLGIIIDHVRDNYSLEEL